MTVRVNKFYRTKYKDPLLLKEGDIVTLGEDEKEEKWSGWVWATFENLSGWIPKQKVKITSGCNGIILGNYSAKELDIDIGDTVNVLDEMNGWLWVKHPKTNAEGWIPKENTEIN